MIFPSLAKQSTFKHQPKQLSTFITIHTHRGKASDTERDCELEIVAHRASECLSSPDCDEYESESAAFVCININMRTTMYGCCFNFWYMFCAVELRSNIISLFQLTEFVRVCLRFVLMFNDNATPNIKKNTFKTNRETQKKTFVDGKKGTRIQEHEMLRMCTRFFFYLLNKHLRYAFYAEPSTEQISRTFIIAYSQLLDAIRLFVLCFIDNCCGTLLWIIQ